MLKYIRNIYLYNYLATNIKISTNLSAFDPEAQFTSPIIDTSQAYFKPKSSSLITLLCNPSLYNQQIHPHLSQSIGKDVLANIHLHYIINHQ